MARPGPLARWALGLGGLVLALGIGLADDMAQGGAIVGWLQARLLRRSPPRMAAMSTPCFRTAMAG
jgi:hypothetical protein